MLTSRLRAWRNLNVEAVVRLSIVACVAALMTYPRAALAQSNLVPSKPLIEAVPIGRLLQDYMDGNASLYFTRLPSPRGYGNRMLVGRSTHRDSVNRLWSVIMTAKVSGKMVGTFYNPTTCQIQSFYLKEG